MSALAMSSQSWREEEEPLCLLWDRSSRLNISLLHSTRLEQNRDGIDLIVK